MRLVIDTNILISALLAAALLPAQLIVLWRAGRFDQGGDFSYTGTNTEVYQVPPA